MHGSISQLQLLSVSGQTGRMIRSADRNRPFCYKWAPAPAQIAFPTILRLGLIASALSVPASERCRDDLCRKWLLRFIVGLDNDCIQLTPHERIKTAKCGCQQQVELLSNDFHKMFLYFRAFCLLGTFHHVSHFSYVILLLHIPLCFSQFCSMLPVI